MINCEHNFISNALDKLCDTTASFYQSQMLTAGSSEIFQSGTFIGVFQLPLSYSVAATKNNIAPQALT